VIGHHRQAGRVAFFDEVEPVEDHVVFDRVPGVVAGVGDRAAADVEGGVFIERGAAQLGREEGLELEGGVVERAAVAPGCVLAGLPGLANAEGLWRLLLLRLASRAAGVAEGWSVGWEIEGRAEVDAAPPCGDRHLAHERPRADSAADGDCQS
jgi:hypothetical protein